MNPISPQPEGSKQSSNLDACLVAACLPGEVCGTHWASGMPLSYVHEMASHWLNVYDGTMRLTLPGVSEADPGPDQRAGDD
jgi:hypothetical protein